MLGLASTIKALTSGEPAVTYHRRPGLAVANEPSPAMCRLSLRNDLYLA